MTTNSELDVHSIDMIDVNGVTLALLDATADAERKLFYRVRDVKAPDSTWSKPVEVPLPNEIRANGQALITVPDAGLEGDPNSGCSALASQVLKAPGTWQVLTQGASIVLLRALQLGTRWQILATRYRLLPAPKATGPDAPALELVLEPEARYERSGVREVPQDDRDRPGFRRPDGTAFVEPVIALPNLEPHGGYFNVVFTPSNEPYAERWVVFTRSADGAELVISSWPRTDQGWPLVTDDSTLFQQERVRLAEGDGTEGRTLLAPLGRPASRLMRRQERGATGSTGVTGPRVLLATRATLEGSTDDVLVTVDFEIAADGRLVVLTDGGTLPLARVGAARSSLAFGAAADLVEVPAAVPQFGAAFTVEAWVRRTGGGTVILERGAADPKAAVPLRLSWDEAAGNIACEVVFDVAGSDSVSRTVRGPAPSLGVWHHIAVTWATSKEGTGGTLTLFIDGKELASDAVSASGAITLPAQGALTAGGGVDPTSGYLGNIAELRLWLTARSVKQIDDNLYRSLPEAERSSPDLAGYWPMSVPQADLALVLDASDHKNDAVAKGADWVTNTPPIGAVDTGYGLSDGMGVLGFAKAAADPTVLASADGLVHLYTVGTAEQAEALAVAHYSTDTNRAEYALDWASSVGDESGVLVLAAHHAGPDMNRGASVDLTADGDGFVSVALRSPAKIGIEETYAGVPADARGFAQVVNGLATSDALSAELRSGKRVFYDYTGTRPTLRLQTDAQPLRLVSARADRVRAAVVLSAATVGKGAGAPVTIDTVVPEITVKTTPVKRAFTPRIEVPKVGQDAVALGRALRGLAPKANAATLSGCEAFALSTAQSPVLVLTATGDALDLTLAVGAETNTLDVEVSVTGPNGDVRAKFPSVPSDSVDFIAALSGLSEEYAYTDDQIAVLARFVAIGASNGAIVSDATLARVGNAPLPAVQAFLNVVDSGAGATLATGKTNAGPQQGALRNGNALPPDATASALFQVTAVPVPLNGGDALLGAGQAVLTQPGNFGGWIPAPPVTAGDFKDAVAHGSVPAQAPLGDVGDTTIEAWVMPRDATSGRQRIVTARGTGDYGLSLGFITSDAYAISLPSSGPRTAAQLVARFSTGPNLSMWWHPNGLTDFAPILFLDLLHPYNPDQIAWEFSLVRRDNQLTIAINDSVRTEGIGITLDDAWYYLAFAFDKSAPSITVSALKLGESLPVSVTLSLPQLGTPLFNLVPHSFGLGTPTLLQDTGSAPPGIFAQLAQWESPLEAADILRLAKQMPDMSDRNLQGYFELSRLDNRSIANLALDPRGTGNLDFTQGDPPTLDQPGPFVTRRPFMAQGRRLLVGASSLTAGRWNHLAAVASDTNAVSFAGTGTIVPRTDKLQFDDGMGIDGWLLLPAAVPRKQVLISKSDAAVDAFSYELSLDPAGRLNFAVTVDTGEVLTFRSDAAVQPGVPTWFGASCEVVADGDPPKGDFSLTMSDPGAKQQTGSVTSTTTYRVRLRGNVALYPQGAARPTVGPEGSPIVYTGTKPRDVTLGATEAKVTLAASAAGTVATDFGFNGILAELRVWSAYIGDRFDTLARAETAPDDLASGLEANWTFEAGEGTKLTEVVAGYDATLPPSASWVKAAATTHLQLYLNGSRIGGSIGPAEAADTFYGPEGQVTLGAVPTGQGTYGDRMNAVADEIRVWSRARSPSEIARSRYAEVNASDPSLVAYWPIMTGNGDTLRDVTGHGYDLGISTTGADPFWWRPDGEPEAPLGIEAPEFSNVVAGPRTDFQVYDATSAAATVEYGQVIAGADGRPRGFMDRYSVYLRQQGGKGEAVFIEAFPVGELDLDYIGQAQTDPTLIGYIEGAPPVPAENLTTPFWVGPNRYQAYDGVTSVTLSDGKEVTYRYEVGRNSGTDGHLETGGGFKIAGSLDMESAPIGFGLQIGGGEFSLSLGAGLEFNRSSGLLKGRSTQATLTDGATHEMSAGGDWEPKQQDRERRYVPDNVGYALVRSSVANVFAMHLPRTGALVGISIVPETKIAPDENVIMFPMNPHYTKQGTLDGYVGFERDPDWLTARPGERSYYRPQEATDLERQIEAQEAKIEALYQAAQVAVGYSDDVPEPGEAAAAGNDDDASSALPLDENFSGNLVNSYVWTADGGIYKENTQTMVQRGESNGGSLSWTLMGGLDSSFSMATPVGGGYFDVKAFVGGHVETTISKSRESSESISLDIEDSCESSLVCWKPDASEPESTEAEPGKVTAYRFKTFYLRPSEDWFDTFFEQVVDQNWLGASDAPDAVALRSAYARRNKLWRVLHRVTYVARVPPTRDLVPAADVPATRMPVIDVEQNRALIDAIESELPNSQLPLRARVAEALDKYLAAQAAGALPWWGWLVQKDPAQAAAVRTRALAYLTAYFESQPSRSAGLAQGIRPSRRETRKPVLSPRRSLAQELEGVRPGVVPETRYTP